MDMKGKVIISTGLTSFTYLGDVASLAPGEAETIEVKCQ